MAAAPGLRPTPDRVRETLFNWLGQSLPGLTTAEPYAGTGVLSLEALSRGAVQAVAADRNPALITALKATADRIGITGLDAHVADALHLLRSEQRRFDVAFRDPPFAEDPWQALFAALEPRLAVGGFIYAEANRRIEPPPWLEIVRNARAGAVHYHLLARNTKAANR